MPAMVHLTRLGYKYFGKIHEATEGTVYDGDTNILLGVFKKKFEELNPGHEGEYLQVLRDIRKELNDDDLGRGFYKRLKSVSPVRLIDFDKPRTMIFTSRQSLPVRMGKTSFVLTSPCLLMVYHFATQNVHLPTQNDEKMLFKVSWGVIRPLPEMAARWSRADLRDSAMRSALSPEVMASDTSRMDSFTYSSS